MKNFKKQPIIALILLVSLALFTSCEKNDDNQTTPQQQVTITKHWGTTTKKDFIGEIVDETNHSIEGVSIKIGGETATTDINGIFVIKEASVYEKFAYITAEKAGYSKGSRSLIPTDGTNQVRIMLLDQNIAGTVSSGSEGEINLPNGTKVKFDGAFKDENDNEYTGDVTVMMQHLASSDSDIDQKMPGMLYAQNANNEERVLETYGMINVELQGAGGEKLNLADGHTATIEMPIDPTQTSTAPSTIELWHFDEEAGVWLEEGSANKQGNKYVGEVSHFSWWNCDIPFPFVRLCVRIEDPDGNPVPGVIAELWRSLATAPSKGWSDDNGEICGFIPANETLTMSVYEPCRNLLYTNSIGPFSTDTDLGTITLTTLETSRAITGTLLDCSNNPITNGYVLLLSDNERIFHTVTNGTFSFTTFSCMDNYFTLEAVDYTNSQATGVIHNTFTPPATNVGIIVTCNSIDEYVTYQIDNEPTIIKSISSGAYVLPGDNFTVYTNSIVIDGNSLTAGTYNSPDFNVSTLDRDLQVPTNIQFILSNFSANIGGYVDMTFSGTYTDKSAVVKNIRGSVHTKRDN